MPYKNNPRSHYGTRSALEWFLDVGYHYATLNETAARRLAAVNRTTFDRWLRGESSAPAATLELLRIHAFGEPPGGFGKEWDSFRFARGVLVSPFGELTPADLRQFHYFKRLAVRYLASLEQQHKELSSCAA